MTSTLAPVSIMRPPPLPVFGMFNLLDFAEAAGLDPDLVGMGLVNDSLVFAACIDAVPDGATVLVPYPPVFYNCDDTIALTDKGIRWIGFQSEIRFSVIGQPGFDISGTADNNAFINLKIKGPGVPHYDSTGLTRLSTDYDNNGMTRLIHVHGTVDRYISGLVVEGTLIDNSPSYGIFGEFVRDVYIGKRTVVTNIFYGAIMFLSSEDGIIESTWVREVRGTVGGSAYGIQFTRNTAAGSTLAGHPPCRNWTVTGCKAWNVWNWAAFGCHSADNITMTSCEAFGCRVGFDMVSPAIDVVTAPTLGKASKNIKLINCHADSGRYDGSSAYGYAMAGFSATTSDLGDPLTGSVIGCTAVGFGFDSAAALNGGLIMRNTLGVVVDSFTAIRCSAFGVVVYYSNIGFTIDNLTAIDCWSNVNTVPGAVAIRSANNTGTIGTRSELRRRQTTLASDAHAGDTALNVTANFGWEPGETVCLIDDSGPTPAILESAVVEALGQPGAIGAGLQLVAPLTGSYPAGQTVSLARYNMIRGAQISPVDSSIVVKIERDAYYSEALASIVGAFA